MPWYRSEKNPTPDHGKIETPTTESEFAEGIEHGEFVKPNHKAYCVLLFYSAVRKGEGARAVKEQFQVTETAIIWNVGPRFKKNKYLKVCPSCKDNNSSRARFCKICGVDISSVEPSMVGSKTVTTPPLTLPLEAPYMNLLKQAILKTPKGQRLFPYSPKTCYNIVHRAFKYPHLFRLTRITWFLMNGYTTTEVKSWTGLSLAALDYYAGLVATVKMGESLAKRKEGRSIKPYVPMGIGLKA